jgi:hypothetical protein
MRIVVASACGITLGIAAGLTTSTALGLTRFTLFDAVRDPADDGRVNSSSPSKNAEADYWRTVARMAEEKARDAERKQGEKSKPETPAKKAETTEPAQTVRGGN